MIGRRMIPTAHLPLTERTDTIDRLRRSLDDVLYAVSITPETWRHRAPATVEGLDWLGGWSVAENLAHLAVYEESIAAPVLEAILAGRDGTDDVISVLEGDYEARWRNLAASPIEHISQRLADARDHQIAAVSSMSDDLFHELTTALWATDLTRNGHSAAWVATKTFQHTWEHGNSILRIALFAPD
jgi:hypothetical protein